MVERWNLTNRGGDIMAPQNAGSVPFPQDQCSGGEQLQMVDNDGLMLTWD